MGTELANTCMITEPDRRVLVPHHSPKLTNPWSALTFLGDYIEPSKSIIASVILKIKEETGLPIVDAGNCEYVQWINPEKQLQDIVFLFKSSSFIGGLKSSAEGWNG